MVVQGVYDRRWIMTLRIAQIGLLVREYDEAIAFYRDALGCVVIEDTALANGKRWVRIAASGDGGVELLRSRAVTPEQQSAVGKQAGGRVFMFLETDDFERDHASMSREGVRFVEPPREEAYGKVAVFVDLYGNRIDLIQPRGASGA
jgi:catechol 2,3-dioxygenase-like lactoylglutathione lyase family enzyme